MSERLQLVSDEPEGRHQDYPDKGCSASGCPRCVDCTLDRCLLDIDPREWKRARKDAEIKAKYYQGGTIAEIAQVMKLSQSTVARALRRTGGVQ